MKIKLTMDEQYRVFIASDAGWGLEVEVPDELIKQFKEADKRFREIEEQVHEYYVKSKAYLEGRLKFMSDE